MYNPYIKQKTHAIMATEPRFILTIIQLPFQLTTQWPIQLTQLFETCFFSVKRPKDVEDNCANVCCAIYLVKWYTGIGRPR